ncbi:MAG: tetratricopeptide repeat protein [Planctomycetota bacterium]
MKTRTGLLLAVLLGASFSAYGGEKGRRIPSLKVVVVTEVTKDAEADRAGFRKLDTLVSFAGKPIRIATDLMGFLKDAREGRIPRPEDGKLPLVIRRFTHEGVFEKKTFLMSSGGWGMRWGDRHPYVVVKDRLASKEAQQAGGHYQRGTAAFKSRRYEEAVEAWTEAVRLAEKTGVKLLVVEFLKDLVKGKKELGLLDEALTLGNRTLALAEVVGEPTTLAGCHVLLANTLRKLHEYDKAVEHAKKALRLCRKAFYPRLEFTVLVSLGQAERSREKAEDSLRWYKEGLQLARKYKSRRREATCLQGMGVTLWMQGRQDDALKELGEALKIFEALGDDHMIVDTLMKMGDATREKGDLQGALEIFKRAAERSGELPRVIKRIQVLNRIGMIHKDLGEYDKALAIQEKALALARSSKSLSGEMSTRRHLGILRMKIGPHEKGLAHHEESLRLARMVKDRGQEASALVNLGSALKQMGEMKKAHANFEEACRIYDALRNKRGRVSTQIKLGELYANWGQRDRARQIYEESLSIARSLNLHVTEAYARRMLADLLLWRGKAERAIVEYEEILKIKRRMGEIPGEADTLTALGRAHANCGRFERAMELLQRGVSLARRIGRTDIVASGLDIIGTIQKNVGKVEEAERCFQEVLAVCSKTRDRLWEAQILAELAMLRLLQNQPNQAEALIEKALATSRELGTLATTASLLRDMGVLHSVMGNRGKALETLLQAKEIHETLGKPNSKIQFVMALCFRQTGTNRPAFATPGRFFAMAFPFAMEVIQEVKGMGAGAAVESWFSEVEYIADRCWWGDLSAKIALDGPWEGVPEPVRQLCEKSPFVGWTLGEVGFFLVESLRARQYQVAMQLGKKDLFAGIDPALTETFVHTENRINAIRQRLQWLHSGGSGMEPAKRAEEAKGLREELQTKWRELESLERKIKTASPAAASLRLTLPPRLKDIQKTLRPDEVFLGYFLTGQKGKGFRIPVGPGGKPQDDTVHLEEVTASGQAFLIAISPTTVRGVPLGTTKELADQVELFRMTLEAQRWCSAMEDYTRLAHGLYKTLLHPVLAGEEGPKIRHLIISPDGPLTRLSFEALLREPKGKEPGFSQLPYVASAYSTEYTPSASAWFHQRSGIFKRGESGEGFVALADPDYGKGVSSEAVRSAGALNVLFGSGQSEEAKKRAARRKVLRAKLSPEIAKALDTAEGTRSGLLLGRLPGTRREVTAIAKLFEPGWTEEQAIVSMKGAKDVSKTPVTVFLEGGARELIAKKDGFLKNAGILHFAAHGIADDLSPAEASIILTTQDLSEAEDGFLTAKEVMRLRTNARLVVLSACETGLGTILRGEGVEGLTRAFQYAGARTVVVSLWKVDDRATTEFMKAFYGALKSKDDFSVSAALAKARREMIAREKVAAPVYWAAFTCHGER